MPLGRKQIRNNAHAFVKEWQGESREHAEAKPFWVEFFQVFGVNRRRVATFEEPVKKADNSTGFVDLLWKGKLLIEHKSKGKDLDKAYTQAINYFPGLKDQELPRYVLVSDFDHFRLHDLDSDAKFEFVLEELPDHIHLFDFIAGYEELTEQYEEYELNIQAAEKLGQLHDALLESGYTGHHLEVFLVRILFCLFAEDTGIFSRHQFINYLINFTQPDGNDTDLHLSKLFQVLDKQDHERSKNLSDELNAFPYVNGHLFAERIDMPTFDSDMHDLLLDGAYFDWGSISPAIFGSLFQSVMDKKTQRNLGAHYTSEKNILRLIKPLFLDELHEELEKIKGFKQVNVKQKSLFDYQKKLSVLSFLDPACGCGNFLVITYREIRRLELAILKEQQKDKQNQHIGFDIDPLISLDHFHGIELEEWPVRIAEVAMWLTQHQMNREFAKEFGREPDLLPLTTAAHIVYANALQIPWEEVVDKNTLNYIIGNPPFRGSKYQTKEQKEELKTLFKDAPNAKQLDYVSCWYLKAAIFMKGTIIKTSFVSTNSITQGEQVEPLWRTLLDMGIHILFAHRTYQWDSEGKGRASVHVVIIGYSYRNTKNKIIFEYPDIQGNPKVRKAKTINPYLVDAPEIVIGNRKKQLCNVPPLWFGNMPLDGGNLLLNKEEKEELLAKEPFAEKWLKPVLGAREFINKIERWCIWLVGVQPSELRKLNEIKKRVELVKEFRLASKAESTRVHAERPTEFRDTRTPETYILIPSVSSERREYVPMGFFDSNTISTNLNLIIPNGNLYQFGILESRTHMTWMRTVAGRLKNDYRYSAKLVYNNYPWPEPTQEQQVKVEQYAQAVLDTRENYPDSSLADLYDPLTMPAPLRKAHQSLDKAVDQCYLKEPFADDAERLSHLFKLYEKLTS